MEMEAAVRLHQGKKQACLALLLVVNSGQRPGYCVFRLACHNKIKARMESRVPEVYMIKTH